MKAYMSQTHERHLRGPGEVSFESARKNEPYYFPVYDRQVRALREARAILAVTEPTYNPRKPWDSGWVMRGNDTPEDTAVALAEALAAFVEG
jgi:hypothetical protein